MYINRQTLWAKKKISKNFKKHEVLVLNDILARYSS